MITMVVSALLSCLFVITGHAEPSSLAFVATIIAVACSAGCTSKNSHSARTIRFDNVPITHQREVACAYRQNLVIGWKPIA